MNIEFIDTFLDYIRLCAYALVILAVLKGIAHKKFSNLLFVGDLIISTVLVITLIYAHFFRLSAGILDEIILTSGAVAWAIIHFISILREGK